MIRNFIAVLVLVPTFAFAEDGSKVVLASNPFNEVLRDAALISGARLVGLVATGEAGSRPDVKASIPGDWKNETVCLKVVSANGLYEAYNAYNVSPDWEGGVTALSYPSQASNQVASIPGEQISGILLKGDCETSSNEAAPVFWGRGQYGTIRLLLNTARSNETYLSFPEYSQQGDLLCDPIIDGARNAFDTACNIPSVLTKHEKLDVAAVSFKNGEMGPEERFVLRFAE